MIKYVTLLVLFLISFKSSFGYIPSIAYFFTSPEKGNSEYFYMINATTGEYLAKDEYNYETYDIYGFISGNPATQTITYLDRIWSDQKKGLVDVLYEFDIQANKTTLLSNFGQTMDPGFYQQQFGYDPKYNLITLAGCDSQVDINIYIWNFDTFKIESVVYKNKRFGSFWPLGAYDSNTGIYYLLNCVKKNRYEIITYNIVTLTQGPIYQITNEIPDIFTAQLYVTTEGQLFLQELNVFGPSLTLYSIRLSSNQTASSTRVYSIDCEYPAKTFQGLSPVATYGDYLLMITYTQEYQWTYTIYDLANLKVISSYSTKTTPPLAGQFLGFM